MVKQDGALVLGTAQGWPLSRLVSILDVFICWGTAINASPGDAVFPVLSSVSGSA
jgi:hypothetical protein